MTRTLMHAIAFTVSLLSLAGCSMTRTASLPDARCRAAGAVAELGQPLTDRTRELARMGAGALRSEVLPYGVPVRQRDRDPQRLNIEVDQQQVIQRMRCG